MVMFMAWVWVSAIVMVGQTYIPISISKSELCIFVAPGDFSFGIIYVVIRHGVIVTDMVMDQCVDVFIEKTGVEMHRACCLVQQKEASHPAEGYTSNESNKTHPAERYTSNESNKTNLASSLVHECQTPYCFVKV